MKKDLSFIEFRSFFYVLFLQFCKEENNETLFWYNVKREFVYP